ncbi:MAG: recombination protein RecR [Bacteriovoracaceae bacterium]|nr:recombination protein RecR [Bacteriovoracaceae bacterium]
MLGLPKKLLETIYQLGRLPGVGEKTATRYSLFLSKWKPEDLETFALSILHLKDLKACKECYFFSEEDLCLICQNEERKQTKMLCVVETVSDAIAIENSGHFKGLFHILGGVLNPLAGIGPKDLHIAELVERIKKNQIKEIVVAINPSVEGDATSSYLRDLVGLEVNVDRIGFGVPVGSMLEYLDPLTITKALENKRSL